MVCAGVYVYAAEVFPTAVRSTVSDHEYERCRQTHHHDHHHHHRQFVYWWLACVSCFSQTCLVVVVVVVWRVQGLGCCNIFARVGGILAPQALQLGPDTMAAIFGGLALGSGLATLLLPETLGRVLE